MPRAEVQLAGKKIVTPAPTEKGQVDFFAGAEDEFEVLTMLHSLTRAALTHQGYCVHALSTHLFVAVQIDCPYIVLITLWS